MEPEDAVAEDIDARAIKPDRDIVPSLGILVTLIALCYFAVTETSWAQWLAISGVLGICWYLASFYVSYARRQHKHRD